MRLHVVDGTYELFRAHYSKRPGHTSATGLPVKATVGLMSSMLSLLEERDERVTHVAVAFDNPIESFRNDMFDGYKTGEGMEPEIINQMDLAEQAVATLGMVVWRMGSWEADDALATAAARWRDRVDQVRILSPDKDLGQSVRGEQVVQVDRMRRRVIDEKKVWELRGVGPASVPDFLALVGDDADGIPGLAGFGTKTAAALLAHYEHIEAIPDDPDAWQVPVRGAARLGATLAGQRDEVALYKKLATLVEDVPLAQDLEDLEWCGVRRKPYLELCDALGVGTLRRRPERWA